MATLHKWHIREGMDGGWYCEREDGKQDEQIHGAHCKACAMSEIISENEDADTNLRGYRDTSCFHLLTVMVRQRRRAAKRILITLAPAFNPEMVEADKATAQELYDAWDAWRNEKVRIGYEYGRSDALSRMVNEANKQIRRIRKELRIRGLPKTRREWEQQERDG